MLHPCTPWVLFFPIKRVFDALIGSYNKWDNLIGRYSFFKKTPRVREQKIEQATQNKKRRGRRSCLWSRGTRVARDLVVSCQLQAWLIVVSYNFLCACLIVLVCLTMFFFIVLLFRNCGKKKHSYTKWLWKKHNFRKVLVCQTTIYYVWSYVSFLCVQEMAKERKNIVKRECHRSSGCTTLMDTMCKKVRCIFVQVLLDWMSN